MLIHRGQRLTLEITGVEENQRPIETKQHQARSDSGVSMPIKGVKTRRCGNSAQHFGTRTRGELDETQDGEQHDHQNRLQGANPNHAKGGEQ